MQLKISSNRCIAKAPKVKVRRWRPNAKALKLQSWSSRPMLERASSQAKIQSHRSSADDPNLTVQAKMPKANAQSQRSQAKDVKRTPKRWMQSRHPNRSCSKAKGPELKIDSLRSWAKGPTLGVVRQRPKEVDPEIKFSIEDPTLRLQFQAFKCEIRN